MFSLSTLRRRGRMHQGGECSGELVILEEIRFILDIPADTLLQYYRGAAASVRARSVDGRTVQFPVNVLQPYVTHEGVRGEFVLCFDDNHRFVSIRKLDSQA